MSISRNEYHEIDYLVMGLVFQIHQELGPYWNEKIYQNELACRCQESGLFLVETEVPVYISLRNFEKVYYIDLLINNSVIYELKTVLALNGEHTNQVLNYLFLTGSHFGKLVNFQTESVEYQYVTTNITSEKRFQLKFEVSEWHDIDSDSKWLKEIIIEMLQEWGAFLDVSLFYDALQYFRGGNDVMRQLVPVRKGEHQLGNQKLNLLNSTTGISLTAYTKSLNSYYNFLKTLLLYTELTAIHWINFNHEKITFKTILK